MSILAQFAKERSLAEELLPGLILALPQMGIVPRPPLLPQTRAALELDQRFATTQHLASRSGLPVPFLGYSSLFSETRLYPGNASDWVMMPLKNDPLFQEYGQRLYAPEDVRQHLGQLHTAGIEMDGLYIAHEITPGVLRPGDPVPVELLRPTPPEHIVRRSQVLERTTRQWWDFVAKTVTTSVRVTNTFVQVGAAVAVQGALGILRDPILFGVQYHPDWQFNGRPIGQWYYLTQWDWPVAA